MDTHSTRNMKRNLGVPYHINEFRDKDRRLFYREPLDNVEL